MKTIITMITAAAVLAPAAVAAQTQDAVVIAREVVREVVREVAQAVQQAQTARRVQDRARQAQYREEQSEKISRTLKIGSNGELDLSNLSGDITVTRGGAVQVEAVKVARARTTNEARAMLALVTVDFVERGSRAEVKAVYPRHDSRERNGRNVNVSVHYTVTAPENTRISVRSLSGHIRVTDIKGDLNLVSLSGDVIIGNGARVMSAKSTSGQVEITNLRSDIALSAGSVSGDLVIRRSRVPRMDLNTISGNVTIDGVECERIDAQTLSGNLEFSSPLAKGGRYELNSHSGDIRIVPTGNTGFELDVSSFSGSIQSALTLEGQREERANFARRGPGPRTRALRGIYGDGSARLDITTFSGSVIVGKK